VPRITPVDWKTLECVFKKAGFVFDRGKGDHRSYVKPGCLRPVVIPKYKEIDIDIIKSNMRTAGMSRDEFFKYLTEFK
jgi:predicted RNA binding protein YcfA (HicA-like mRNA interferase family)